jgi:acetolactate synthase I/II/III large subunit
MRWTGMMRLIDRPEPPPHLIRIDIDPLEMERLRVHAPIVADAAEGAIALRQAIRRSGRKATLDDRDPIQRARAEAAVATRKVQPQMAYLEVIRQVLPRNGIFVEELSQVGFTSYFGYPVLAPRTYISPGFQGTLGFGFQAALGVKVAHPDKPVVSVTGDGGFMFGVQELATAVQYRIGVVVVLFNNDSYGNVLRDQQAGFGGREIGAEIVNPDFLQLARAFGVEGHRVASPEELRPVLSRAVAGTAPVLIEVAVERGSEVSPWEFIHPEPLQPGL